MRSSTTTATLLALTAPTLTFAQVAQWGQCGGVGYTGSTTCASGLTCFAENQYYSQCRPSAAAPAPSTLKTTAAVPAPTSGSSSGAKCSLDARFKAKGKKFFGAATDQWLLTNKANEDVLLANFGQITHENSMKWESTQKTEGTWSLTNANTVVDWATTNKKAIRGHTTVWHSQLPTWVSSISDPVKLRQVVVDHVTKLVGTYKGRIAHWDVVNEAFAENGSLRASVFYNVLGEDYIRLAFETARKADPAAKLYINDYNLDSATYAKTKGFASKVAQWVAAGVPIDGAGSQAHLSQNWPIADFAAATKLICGAASECAITELDIKGAPAAEYVKVVDACLKEPKCVGITVWGVSDKDSWRKASTPLLFDASFQAKSAYNAICDLLA